MPEFHVHWVTVLIGTAAYFVLGAVWYGALSKPWLKAIGLEKEDVQRDGANWIYGPQLLATFVLVVLSSYVLHDALRIDDVASGILGGLLLGVIASLASSGDFLFEQRRRNLSLFLINSGYRVVALTVLGIVVGLFGS
ncbi:MAG: hypothetical protein JWM25_230 [Thermoleophilia bacterium]|nr:hypothetical protein [Thermoleophilia bacterium]